MLRTTFFTLCASILSAGFASNANAQELSASGPRIGEVKSLAVITISLAVGSTGQEARRVFYAPPPGWYVRGHRVECREKTGLSSFTVNTLPKQWSFLSEEQARDAYRALLELETKTTASPAAAKILAEQERTSAEIRKAISSHHVLLVEAMVKGEGLFRSGSTLQLTVVADLVFIGTQEHLVQQAKTLVR